MIRGTVACLLSFVLWFLASSAHAQILNIEKKRLEQQEDNYLVGNVGLNFNYNNRSPTLQEPVRVMSTGLNSHVGYFTDGNAYLLINDYDLLRINENSVVDTGVSHLRVQFLRDKLINYEAYTQYQYDRPRGMRFRGLVGGGGRLRLVRTEPYTLTMGVGLMYEHERWAHPDDGPRVRADFLKLNTYFSSRAELSETADLNGVVYYQVGYDQSHEVYRQRFTGELNLAVKIVGALSLTSSFQAAYETRPLVPILRLIYASTNGLRLDF